MESSYHLLKSTASLLIILCCCLAQASHGAPVHVLFSSLPPTLIFTASPPQGQVLNAGEDTIALTWGLNQSLAAGTDDSYIELKVKLCFAPISQLDRGWRKTLDDLSKDKTCQFTVFEGPYQRNQSFEWKIEKDVATAVYFVRAYVFDSAGKEVAYGQTTDAKKRDRLFEIKAISGRHLSLDIASGCFSAFSLVSLIGFFMLEKYRNKVL